VLGRLLTIGAVAVSVAACAGEARAAPGGTLTCAPFAPSPTVALEGHDANILVDCWVLGEPVSPVTAVIDAPPAHGTLVAQTSNDTTIWFRYRSTPGYRGADGFTWHAVDQAGRATAPSTYSLTVDRLLACSVVSYPAPQNPAAIPLRNDAAIQVGFSCAPGEPGDDFTIDVARRPQHGTFTELSDEVDTNIRVTYRPDAGYVGPDEFDVSILTGKGGRSMTYAFPLDVIEASANRPPACQDTPVTIGIGGVYPIEPRCVDLDGDPISYRVVTPPQHGALRTEPRVFWYTAAPGFNGWDSLTYAASDGRSETLKYVGIQVGPAPPQASAPAPPAPGTPPPAAAGPASPTSPALPRGLVRAPDLRLGPAATAYLTRASKDRRVRVGRRPVDLLVVQCAKACALRADLSLRRRGRARPVALPGLRRELAAGAFATVRLAVPAKLRRRLAGAPGLAVVTRLRLREAGGAVWRDAIRFGVRLTR